MRIAIGRQYVEADRRVFTLALLLLLLFIVGLVSAYYFATRRPLSKLPGITSLTRSTPPHFQSTFYGVSGPFGVAVNPDGQRIYVTESTGERQVRAFDRAGNQLMVFSPPGSKVGTRMPMYVAVDKAGQVYVTDRLRAAVDVYDPDGRYLYRFPREGNPTIIRQPLGISIDRSGDIYVTDVVLGQHRLLVFDADGNLKLGFGKEGRGSGDLSWPNASVVHNQLVYVADSNNGRLSIFNADGSVRSIYGWGSGDGTVGLPRGVAVDAEERLYVVDALSHLVNVYDIANSQIKYFFSFGKEGLGQGEFAYPNGIAIDPAGRIYVTDRENQRVQVWSH